MKYYGKDSTIDVLEVTEWVIIKEFSQQIKAYEIENFAREIVEKNTNFEDEIEKVKDILQLSDRELLYTQISGFIALYLEQKSFNEVKPTK